MRAFLISIALTAAAVAGNLNLVHLGPPDEVRIEISCDGKTQEIPLPHGAATGQFILPEKEATIRLPGTDLPSLTIPATPAPQIAILTTAAEGYRWLLIPGKPAGENWAMRAINLTPEPVTLQRGETPIELAPDAPTDIPVAGKNEMTVKPGSDPEFTYDASEPSAVLALIHRKGEAIHVLFVPDR